MQILYMPLLASAGGFDLSSNLQYPRLQLMPLMHGYSLQILSHNAGKNKPSRHLRRLRVCYLSVLLDTMLKIIYKEHNSRTK